MALATGKRVETVVSAARLYETAALQNLWMDPSDAGIHLFCGQVIENDGPGGGNSDDEGRQPFGEVSGGTAFKKMVLLDVAPAGRVRLAFIGQERKGHQATLRFTVNGHAVLRTPSPVAAPEAKQYWDLAKDEGAWSWSRWYYVALPEGCLKSGENAIVVESVDGHIGWSLMVADYRDFEKGMAPPVMLPETSYVRKDGLDSWEEERGEYVLRLALEEYRSSGELISEVIDIAGENDCAVKSRVVVRAVTLDAEVDAPKGTAVEFEVRTGADPRVGDAGWSGWKSVQPGESLGEVQGRYVQWKALFSTENPAFTPVLKAVRFEADVDEEDGSGLRIVRVQNARILRPSRPYEHEDYRCEMLAELRKRFELDAVVAGAQTEFELIERLMTWAYFVPLSACRHYPWNVLDWLVLERDVHGDIVMNEYKTRRRDKMCLYPNVVLVAACLSFGIPARHVNFHSEGMTGHEIAEVWSNDYQKWVHLDATRDYFWYDPATLTPLDTLEVHQVLMDRLDEVERWDRPYLFRQDLEAVVKDLPIMFSEGHHALSVQEGALFLFRSFSHFRMIPRNNTFSKQGPLPVSQGTEVWSWNGYLNWADEKAPPLLHFNGHTNRRADFYPTMNQTRFTAEQTGAPGELGIFLETDMPGFGRYEMRVDRETWVEVADRFVWTLQEGVNILEVRGVNVIGVEGIVSSLAVVV